MQSHWDDGERSRMRLNGDSLASNVQGQKVKGSPRGFVIACRWTISKLVMNSKDEGSTLSTQGPTPEFV